MPSSNCVDALLEPPNQFVALPWAKCASTSRGWTTPRSRTKSSTAFAWRQRAFVHTLPRRARMHQRVHFARHEAVVDEEVLFDRQARIATLEVTGTVVGDAVAKRQVLRARRGADGIGLNEAELRDCPREASSA